MDEDKHSLRLEFPSTMTMVDRAGEVVRGFLARNGLSDKLFELGLMSREAICNAVIHGCGCVPDLQVRFELDIREGWVVIVVADPGEGWDWRSHDYALPSEFAVGGRGLFIIRSYSDEMAFNDKGNEIVIRKRIAG